MKLQIDPINSTGTVVGQTMKVEVLGGSSAVTDLVTAAALTAHEAAANPHSGSEPSQTSATQLEMETGTETAIRSMSPLRVAQAIDFRGVGLGDMTKAVYDPTTVAGDAFDMDNMVEGATKKILTSTERSAISANTAKNSYPSADATKLAGIATGAEVNRALASQAQAEAGTDNVKGMTPLRVFQAVASWAATATSVFKGILTNYKEGLYTTTTTGNITIDLANGNVQRITLDAIRQITMPADPGSYGQSFVLILECATFTPTWGATPVIEWLTSDGAAPTLVTTANLVNVVTFIWDDTDSRWLGFLGGSEVA